MLTVERAPVAEVELAHRASIRHPALAWIGVDHGEVVGSGGLAWINGQCWLFFEVLKPDAAYVWPIIRQGRILLRRAAQLGETDVFTPRDAQYETSERLLKLLKFEPHSVENGIEVWRWRVSLS